MSEKKFTPKLVVLAMTAHCMEWFDFSVYASLSTVLAELFFPSYSPEAALIASLGIFASGFLVRPLGAICLGYLGDKIGRKKILIFSMLLMTLSTVGMGLLPTYAQIGVWAPFMLLFLRMVQGFSVSGETGTSIVYFIEQIHPKNKFLMGSFLGMGFSIGYVLASIVTIIVSKTLTHEEFYLWGWRIPFLAGIALGFFALVMRFTLKESEPFLLAESRKELSKNPLRDLMRVGKKEIGYLMAFVAFASVYYYMLIAYLFIYMKNVGGLSLTDALSIISIAVCLKIVLMPFIGWMIDRYIGYKPAMLFGVVSCLLLTPFLFTTLAKGNFESSLVAVLIYSFLANFYQAPCPGLVGGMLPVNIRSTGVSIGWNFIVAFLGGTTPLITALLQNYTGSLLSPAYYLSFAALISLIAVITYRPLLNERH